MRKLLIAMLMTATAVTPITAAYAQDRGDRASVERADRGDRGSARQVTPQRAPVERQATAQRAVPQRQTTPVRAAPQRPITAQRPDRSHVTAPRQSQNSQQARQRLGQQSQQRAQVQQQTRQRWDGNWRHNQRYNWQQYRQSHRTAFRMPTYHAPYSNYRYSRLSIGFTLGSSFLNQRYSIGDPWQYRLPAAYPGYEWVRYYNDVLLVDTRTGQVADVIYDFFW